MSIWTIVKLDGASPMDKCPIDSPTDMSSFIYAFRSRFSARTFIYVFRLVFNNYDPNFIAGSLNEAYLDITDQISEELRSSVYTETGLTCSAGVAANRLLAKICSDISSLMDRLFFKMTDQLS